MRNKQIKGLARNTIDKYYTNPTIVVTCLELVRQHLKISRDDLVIEPSAGDGSFISEIKVLTNNHRFYDLEPENDEITRQDYLQYDFKNDKLYYVKIMSIKKASNQ